MKTDVKEKFSGPFAEISNKVIQAAYEVSNTLGCGFLEKVYRNALQFELEAMGVKVQRETPLQVTYKGCVVGEFFADLLVDDVLIVELKAVDVDLKIFVPQIINYLNACGNPVGLLINFGRPKLPIRRLLKRELYEQVRASRTPLSL